MKKVLLAIILISTLGCKNGLSKFDDLHLKGYDIEILERTPTHAKIVCISPNAIDTTTVAVIKGAYSPYDGYWIPKEGNICECRPRLVSKMHFYAKTESPNSHIKWAIFGAIGALVLVFLGSSIWFYNYVTSWFNR